jgi:hypothetical protein
MPAFPPFPVVIRRSKRLGSILVFITGLPLALALYQRLLHPAWIPAPASPSVSGPVSFLAVFLLGVLFLLRPARLILTPDGLTYERLLRLWRRSWRWQDVSAFEWARFGSGKNKRHAIGFTSDTRTVEVPGYWELSSEDVLTLLNEARRLGRGAAVAVPDMGSLPAEELAPTPSAAPNLMGWLVGLLLIGAGSLLTYLFNYKDNFLLQCVCMLLVVFGWLFLLFLAFAALPSTSRQGHYNLRPATWKARLARRALQLSYLVVFVGWITLLVGNLFIADQQGGQRVARILATEPTATTVATVTGLRERRGRSSTIRSTLLTYQAGAEQVTQALPGIGQYAVGQRLRVRYAVGHPDMFAVVE